MRESIKSVVDQTIGFDRIQLILVDDGSKDSSGSICDEYQKKYPNNIEVIHKPNGGLSSARNTGLAYVRGKYVTFTDPDDILSRDAMQKVYAFMEQYAEIVDICCIPMELFGDQKGPHLLNRKFQKGTRVIDLSKKEDSENILLHACSAFYNSSVAKSMQFDTVIYTAEDAIENMKILLNNPNLGVVSDTTYHYRRHGDSIVAKSKGNANWYTEYLNRFPQRILDYAVKMKGYVPLYIQSAIMYDLQWKIQQSHINSDVLSDEERKEYTELLLKIVSRIDDDVICGQRSLETERKLFLLYSKYGFVPNSCLRKNCPKLEGYPFPVTYEYLATEIDFLRFEGNSLICEGSQIQPYFEPGLSTIYYTINGKKAGVVSDVQFDTVLYVTDIPFARRKHFKAEIPLSQIRKLGKVEIGFVCTYGNDEFVAKRIYTNKYAPISTKLSKSYYRKGNFILRPVENGFSVTFLEAWKTLTGFKSEIAFQKQLLFYHYKGAKKACVLRNICFAFKHILPDDIWLITDKADRADDNGEAFFRYLIENKHKVKCHPVFAVGKNTPDYERIKRIGKVVPYMSWRHKILHLLSKHTISAYSHDEISTPFHEYSFYYGDLLQCNKIVFLQHGIIKDDISKGYHRFHKNFSMFVTSTRKEQKSIIDGNYAYDKDHVVLTGLPRYDLLYTNTKKIITIMPTWVRKLCGNYNAEDSSWELLPGFENSEYYCFYSALLNNELLLTSAEKTGYKIRFLIHPVFHRYVNRFHIDSRVEVMDSNSVYRDVFAESALITTDYSSVAFDFAYLRKPVIYTQFESNHYEEGYFDYERDGFGEIEYTVGETVNRLISYMENGCELKDKYANRIDNFFEFHDAKNCERVYNAILSMDSPRSKNNELSEGLHKEMHSVK